MWTLCHSVANTRNKEFRRLRLAELGVSYDADVEELVCQYTWRVSPRGYVEAASYIEGEPKTIKLHRLVMGHLLIVSEIDHIDRDKLNNVRTNLRVASSSLNSINREYVDNAKHIKDRGSYFELTIRRNNIALNKCFKTFEEAQAARQEFLLACGSDSPHGYEGRD